MESKNTKSQATNEKDSKKYSEISTKTQRTWDLDSKTSTCHIERSEISHTTHKGLDSIENIAQKDRIFLQDTTQPMPKFEFNEMVASVFDDMLERSIPFYDEVMNLAIFFIREHLQTMQKSSGIPVIYDLGSSTGNLLLRLAASLEECKMKAELCGIDNALAMIERAQLKSAAMGFNIDFFQHSIICASSLESSLITFSANKKIPFSFKQL